MTRAAATRSGTLDDPVPIESLPFADTIDVAETTARPDEPSPCLPSATSTWYVLRVERAGTLAVDLAGSTPLDPVVRLYRQSGHGPPTFLGCASPVWNAQLALELPVGADDVVLAQVGTSESLAGRLVVRVELRG
jgi:hypothetical protein